jgi:transposase
MALPSTVSQPSATGSKSAILPKRKRGGQRGNQNARKLGIFSVHQPGHLSQFLSRAKTLQSSLRNGAQPPHKIVPGVQKALVQLLTAEKKIKSPSIAVMQLELKLIMLSVRAKAQAIPAMLRARTLENLATDPFTYFENDYRDWGITRDADSFFPVSKLSARNSPSNAPDSPLQMRSIWGGAGGGAEFATNLTDEQWAVLEPLIPPDPWLDWLTGEPPVIIAANRWNFTRYIPTGEFKDFAILQNYRQVLQRTPTLMAPAPLASTAKKRGRPCNSISPRALLNAIIWKLATAQNWDALPGDFPPMRLCRKYYRRLFLSGRFYTLMLALYNHMRLETDVDPWLLLQAGLFTTTPSQNIALSAQAESTWQNYTALLFMQLAREAYARLERNRKQAQPIYRILPVLKGDSKLSTGRIPGPNIRTSNLWKSALSQRNGRRSKSTKK